MTIFLVDSHCHLDFPDFAHERDTIVERAGAAGIGMILTISTYVARIESLLALAGAYPNVFTTVGTHPNSVGDEPDVSTDELVGWAGRDKVVGIGEAGLDYFYDKAPRDVQAWVFRRHIAASRRTGLPLVIHAREADDDMRRILEEETEKGAFPFILHCFSSGSALAETGVALGGTVSFSGILTFRKSDALRDIAASVPMDRLLVETDAPYLAPMPYRGKRNEPAYVRHTAEVLADVKGVDLETLAATTSDNFFKLFGKIPDPRQIRDPVRSKDLA